MSWDGARKLIGATAPMLGSLLGGPAGGAVAGMVASALGCEPTPAAISAAAADPKSAIKLRELELAHAQELQRMSLDAASTDLAQVNETMRAETKSDDGFTRRWRPFWGYMSAIGFFLQVGAVSWVMVSGGDPALINSLGQLSVFWTVPLAVVGVTAYGRSREKVARITGERGGIGGLINAARGADR